MNVSGRICETETQSQRQLRFSATSPSLGNDVIYEDFGSGDLQRFLTSADFLPNFRGTNVSNVLQSDKSDKHLCTYHTTLLRPRPFCFTCFGSFRFLTDLQASLMRVHYTK